MHITKIHSCFMLRMCIDGPGRSVCPRCQAVIDSKRLSHPEWSPRKILEPLAANIIICLSPNTCGERSRVRLKKLMLHHQRLRRHQQRKHHQRLHRLRKHHQRLYQLRLHQQRLHQHHQRPWLLLLSGHRFLKQWSLPSNQRNAKSKGGTNKLWRYL